jgi:hypothetical protein
MAALTDDEIERAMARGETAAASEPRAASARYDSATGRMVVEMTNGCAFAFPTRLAEGLETADEDALAGVAVSPGGYGLRWETLDVDLSVPGLLAGLYGTRRHMARLAGSASTPAKAAAARRNGAAGGRPRKAS